MIRQPAIFVPMAGGLGDILQYYLDGEFGYFPALKQSTAATLAVKIWSVCNKAPELFAHHPAVDHILTQPFAPVARLTDGFRPFAERTEKVFRLMTDREHGFRWERQPFYLAHDEKHHAERIESLGPYIAVHPFAGRPERSIAKAGLADAIIRKASEYLPVVILGGNSNRNDGLLTAIFEGWDQEYPNGNVVNLVNKGSVRLHAHVASKATKFIGSVSCYNCVAHSCNVPALVFGSYGNRHDMKTGGSVFKKMRDRATPIHYLDQVKESDVSAIVREFVDDLG